MIHIGRYRISFHRAFWLQTQVATTVRRFGFLWVVREARPTDVDKKKRFDIGTPMVYEGRRYHYWRAPSDTPAGQVVWLTDELPDEQQQGV